MNPIIKDQLERCRVANLPYYDEDTTTLTIPKGSAEEVNPYQVHKCYLLQLEEYIVNPPPDFSLHTNWNKGSIPKSRFYNAEISQVMGKMIRISGCGYDMINQCPTADIWEGWVPQKGIKLIKELK